MHENLSLANFGQPDPAASETRHLIAIQAGSHFLIAIGSTANLEVSPI